RRQRRGAGRSVCRGVRRARRVGGRSRVGPRRPRVVLGICMAVRIGELLLKEKRITAEQLQEALNYQRQHGGKLGYNLIKLGYVKDEEITALLSKQYGVPSIAL